MMPSFSFNQTLAILSFACESAASSYLLVFAKVKLIVTSKFRLASHQEAVKLMTARNAKL